MEPLIPPGATGVAVGNALTPDVVNGRRGAMWTRVSDDLARRVRIHADFSVHVPGPDVEPPTGAVAGSSGEIHYRPGWIIVGRGYVALCSRAPYRSWVCRGRALSVIDDGPRTEWGINKGFRDDVRLPNHLVTVVGSEGTYAHLRIQQPDVPLLQEALRVSAGFAQPSGHRVRLMPLLGFPLIWIGVTLVFTLVFWIVGVMEAAKGSWESLGAAAFLTAVGLAPGSPWVLRSWSRAWEATTPGPVSEPRPAAVRAGEPPHDGVG